MNWKIREIARKHKLIQHYNNNKEVEDNNNIEHFFVGDELVTYVVLPNFKHHPNSNFTSNPSIKFDKLMVM